MTLSDKLTRDQVRDAFNRNLTYADLCGIDIRALQGFIAIECARHDRKLASKGELLMLMQPSCLKKHAPNISASTERPGIYEAFLRVDGRYWQGREAVSFNGDGSNFCELLCIEEVTAFVDQLLSIGLLQTDENGCLENPRMHENALSFGKKRAAGRKGGRPRKNPQPNQNA